MIMFWALAQWLVHRSGYAIFADYLIESHRFATMSNPRHSLYGKILMVGGGTRVSLATFDEFAFAAATDADALYALGPPVADWPNGFAG